MRATIRRTTVVRSTTDDTAKRLYKMGATQVVHILPEIGLLDEEVAALNTFREPGNQPIRFISLGRLLHWKGFYLGLKAFATAQLPNAEYWVVGDGPERATLQKIVDAHGLTSQVKFWGFLPREQALEKLEQCDVLVHPSLHDSGGWVCIEAMAAGRPVICLQLGGPAVQVTAETGFKVAARTPEQAIRDMASAMKTLAASPELLSRMSAAGKQLVHENYSWSVVGEKLNGVYQSVNADRIEPLHSPSQSSQQSS